MRKEILREKQKMSGVLPPEDGDSVSRAKRRLAVKIAGWIVFLSVVLLLMTALVSIHTAKSRGGIPSFLGRYQLFVVESGSMEPTFDIGTVILSKKPKAPESMKENDIVTFRTLAGHIVTHRIVEVIPGEDGKAAYRTRGDNPQNSTDQELLTSDRVIAVFIAKIPLT